MSSEYSRIGRFGRPGIFIAVSCPVSSDFLLYVANTQPSGKMPGAAHGPPCWDPRRDRLSPWRSTWSHSSTYLLSVGAFPASNCFRIPGIGDFPWRTASGIPGFQVSLGCSCFQILRKCFPVSWSLWVLRWIPGYFCYIFPEVPDPSFLWGSCTTNCFRTALAAWPVSLFHGVLARPETRSSFYPHERSPSAFPAWTVSTVAWQPGEARGQIFFYPRGRSPSALAAWTVSLVSIVSWRPGEVRGQILLTPADAHQCWRGAFVYHSFIIIQSFVIVRFHLFSMELGQSRSWQFVFCYYSTKSSSNHWKLSNSRESEMGPKGSPPEARKSQTPLHSLLFRHPGLPKGVSFWVHFWAPAPIPLRNSLRN